MFLTGFVAGLFFEFIVNRICDSISHHHAMRIGYDCDRCNYRCNGYHCYKMRQEIADGAIEGAYTIEGGNNEISDVPGEDPD